MLGPLMLLEYCQRDSQLSTRQTYVPKVFIGTVSVQPVSLHKVQCRSRPLLLEELESTFRSDCRQASQAIQPTWRMS